MTVELSRRRVAAIVSILLLLSLVVLLLWPGSLPTERNVDARELPWNLPVEVTVKGDDAVSVIMQRRLWASTGVGTPVAAASADETALTPPNWRIAGVFSEAASQASQGGRWVVLIASQGQTVPRSLRVGDILPGGARITAISRERVGLLLNGQQVSLSTYSQ